MNHLLKMLFRVFFSSALQFFLFFVVLIAYTRWIPWPPNWWAMLVAVFLIPIFGGIVCCRIMHWKDFRFDWKNVASKPSVFRLVSRIVSMLCVFGIGLLLEASHSANPDLPLNILFGLGLSNDTMLTDVIFTIFGSLFNASTYITAAIFPMTFALVEFLFVSAPKEYPTK